MERPMLPLGDYLQLLSRHGLLRSAGTGLDLTARVSAVTCDSRAAVPGCLFLCKGAAFKEEYLLQALSQGAFAYVSEKPYHVPAPCIRVTDIRLAMGLIADLAWDHPSGKVRVIGLTGTKGKTTTAWFIKSILDVWRESLGLRPVGLLSSLITDDGVLRAPSVLTTPEPLELQEHLWNAAASGCGYVVMECSSQALKYGRMTGTELFAGAFLNIGEDHISPKEHPSVEDYFQSKLKLFDFVQNAVVNLDSDHAEEITAAARRRGRTIHPYSLSQARDVRREGRTMVFTASYLGAEESFSIPMTGSFNVSNALCALTVCALLEVPGEYVRAGLAKCVVPGRMETYESRGKTVIVDYAHNALSLEALLRAVRADFPGVPLTAVFGCVGDKALDRREGMGLAAGRLADHTVLTEDDPGSEDVTAICREVGGYITAAGGSFTVVPDREQAVRTAIETAPAPAVIVLAGKGAETAQKRAHGPEPCVPDALLAQKYLGLLS